MVSGFIAFFDLNLDSVSHLTSIDFRLEDPRSIRREWQLPPTGCSINSAVSTPQDPQLVPTREENAFLSMFFSETD